MTNQSTDTLNDWENGLIVNLTDDGLSKENAESYVEFVQSVLDDQKSQIIEQLEEAAYVPKLGSNQQWTGNPVPVINLDQAIKLISEQ